MPSDPGITTFLLVLLGAVMFVFVGNLVGKFLPPLNRFALPGAVMGGVLALLLGPQVAGTGWPPGLGNHTVSSFYEALRDFPGIFINIVFACLMLGRRFEPIRQIWHRAKPQIVMGHLFAWGQYVLGLLLTIVLLAPVLGISELAGPLIAIGFQGGHGTAAGLGENFAALGFEAGEDFALAVATVGVLAGVVGGPFLANFLKRKHDRISGESGPAEPDEADIPQNLKPNPLTGRLTVHLAMVGIVVGLAWAFLRGLQRCERLLRGDDAENYLSDFLPLFSIVLLTGMGVQALLQKIGWDLLFDRNEYEKIGSFALDMVIVGALATLSLEVLSDHWLALGLLCLTGLGWNVALLFLVGPRTYRRPWYAYGVGDLGGGTATTASGIMLIKVVDPNQKTDALKAYADKQPFYEPIMGGGLVTALALPAVSFLGPWACLGITSAIFLGWSAIAWNMNRP